MCAPMSSKEYAYMIANYYKSGLKTTAQSCLGNAHIDGRLQQFPTIEAVVNHYFPPAPPKVTSLVTGEPGMKAIESAIVEGTKTYVSKKERESVA